VLDIGLLGTLHHEAGCQPVQVKKYVEGKEQKLILSLTSISFLENFLFHNRQRNCTSIKITAEHIQQLVATVKKGIIGDKIYNNNHNKYITTVIYLFAIYLMMLLAAETPCQIVPKRLMIHINNYSICTKFSWIIQRQ
jgi:hypothetical protein